MKFTCLQENLTSALSKVYRAIPTKSELPILANVLISAKDGQVKLAATSLATTIVTYMGASVEQEGEITVPAKIMRDFIANLSPSTIEIHLENDILHLNSDTTNSKFNGVTAQDFPDLPQEPEDIKVVKISAKNLNDAVSSVAFAASADDSRPIFTGIYLSFSGDKLTAASSDGYRLSEVSVPLIENAESFSAVIPAKTLLEVSKIFYDNAGDVDIMFSQNENLCIFKQEETTVATRILNGDYPDYKRIIPVDSNVHVLFDVKELLEAVKLTNIFAKESDSTIVLKLDPQDKSISLEAMAKEKGAHTSKVQADIESVEETSIGFNSKYLMDFLMNIKSQQAVLKTKGSATHCLFLPQDQSDYIHIIMPVQINKT